MSAHGSFSSEGTADVAPPPLCSNLTATARSYLGRKFVIFKNPISLAYYRLPAAHAEAAQIFDGKIKLRDIARKLAAASLYWRALSPDHAVEELSSLASQLGQGGLLQVRGSSAAERGRRLRELKAKRGFETAVGHVLFFRKSLYDPDRLLGRLLPWVAWVYRPALLGALLLFVVITLGAALWNYQVVVAQSANFFTLSNLGLTWLLFIMVKVLHEFSHGLTAKRFGAEVHEMGFMFILFTPYLFCNVSDVWRGSKTARIATGAAGLVVELFLAATAFWLWFSTQPGLFHQMCFNTMVLCSISTLLFNGNPLMKFDGYYILSDALEIPNLRAKSNAWVTGWAQKYLLGKTPPKAAASHEANPLFGFYAVAAYCYGWFILFSISTVIFDVLKPYGLEFVSRTYVALFLFVSVALPLYRLGQSVRGTPSLHAVFFQRARIAAVGVALIFGFVLVLPWQESIRRSAVLEHARVATVSGSAPGILREVLVSEGGRVESGQVLGRLHSPDLECRLAALRLDREAMLVQLRALSADSSHEARLGLPVAAKQVRELDEEIVGVEKKMATLELKAPFSGLLRTSRPAELAGRYFAAGQPVFEVGEDVGARLLIALDEQQARKVRPGQDVRAVFSGLPGEVFRGKIIQSPVSPAANFSAPSLSNLLGGDVPSEFGSPDQAPMPSMAHFEAEAFLDIEPEMLSCLRAQSAARARIEVRHTTLAGWLRDRFYEVVSPDVRL